MKTRKLLTKVIAFALTMQTIFTGLTAHAIDEVTVMLDDKPLTFDVPAQIIDDRTMVPVRGIFEGLDYVVTWSASDKKIKAQKEGISLEMQIDNKEIIKNGLKIYSDVAPQITDGRTLVPLRVISECSGCTVEWDSKTYTVVIKTPQPQKKAPENLIEDKTTAAQKTEEPTKVTEKDDTNKANDTVMPKAELSCNTSVSKSVMSVGGYYRIVLSATASGHGGTEPYKYRYELIQNGKTVKESNFSVENTVEGTIEGNGDCMLIFYVKDASGDIAKQEIDLTQ